jgi:hypothetical protein
MKFNQYFTSINTFLFTVFIGVSLSFYANSHIQNKSYFDHLSEVNKEWKHYKDAAPEGMISFDSDLDRIQLHLNLVIEHLKVNNPSNLNSDQLSNRLTLLGKLKEYADNKVFPINIYHSVRTPYFVDHLGTNCAVGQMIYVSGNEDLVAEISKEHNYDYLKDIHTEGLLEWANEFGFTLDELKWIQPGYPPTQTMEQVLGGTNGEVTKIELSSLNGDLSIAGEFTELDNLPCLNFGYYKNNQLSCYGNGIDGKINDIQHKTDGVYVFGAFNHNGEDYPIAKYDGANWNYIGIPNREGATASVANFGGLGYKYEVAIAHGSIPNHQEIWYYMNNNTWERQAKVNGIINDIKSSGYGRVHVGNFDSVFVFNSNSSLDTTLVVNNVVISANQTDVWFGIGDDISDTVNSVIVVGNALIFGGTCGYESGDNKVCLSRYYNSVLQPLFLNTFGQKNHSINALAYKSGNKITFGGDFHIEYMMGTYGSNLATYDLVYNSVKPIAILDQPVNSLQFLNNDLYIGGDFQSDMGSSINHLGRIVSTVGLNEETAETNHNVYPNPFNSIINLESIENGTKYSILNIDGRLAKNGTIQNEKINDLDFLPKGSYLLHLETKKGVVVKKVFK